MNSINLINKIAKGPLKKVLDKSYKSIAKTALRKYIPVGNIFIEISSVCNLKCPGCYRSTHQYNAKNRFMPLEDFKYYVNQLPLTYRLTLSGLGEPTLNPNIVEMVNYVHNSKKFNLIGFTTNILAKDPVIYKELFSKGLNYLFISVDSLNQDEADKLRTGTNVNFLIRNLKYLQEELGNKITINMVISKINLHNFKNTVIELNKLGIRSIKLQPFEDNGDPSKCLSEQEEKIYLRYAEEVKDRITITDSRFKTIKKPCYSPYTSALITVDGYLTPCCRVVNKDIFNLGNLKETSFKNLFFSEKVFLIQKNIKKGKYPLFCKGCLLNHTECNTK